MNKTKSSTINTARRTRIERLATCQVTANSLITRDVIGFNYFTRNNNMLVGEQRQKTGERKRMTRAMMLAVMEKCRRREKRDMKLKDPCCSVSYCSSNCRGAQNRLAKRQKLLRGVSWSDCKARRFLFSWSSETISSWPDCRECTAAFTSPPFLLSRKEDPFRLSPSFLTANWM